MERPFSRMFGKMISGRMITLRRCNRIYDHETHEIHERAGVVFIHHGIHRIHGRKKKPLPQKM
jgi:hypothetical protein